MRKLKFLFFCVTLMFGNLTIAQTVSNNNEFTKKDDAEFVIKIEKQVQSDCNIHAVNFYKATETIIGVDSADELKKNKENFRLYMSMLAPAGQFKEKIAEIMAQIYLTKADKKIKNELTSGSDIQRQYDSFMWNAFLEEFNSCIESQKTIRVLNKTEICWSNQIQIKTKTKIVNKKIGELIQNCK